MDFSRLEQNLIDVIKEEQVKLGYRSETIRLYYPLQSLNRFLGSSYAIAEMGPVLEQFCESRRERFGRIEVSHEGERFCFKIPPQGVDYVHDQLGDKEFIVDFVRTVSRHGCTIDEALQQFYKYSDHVHVERTRHGEFDYLIYFADGQPDSYRYCLTDEDGHIIYHRFTIEDYNDFDF